MNLHSITVASVFLAIYFLLSAAGQAQEHPGQAQEHPGQAQEGPGQAYRRAASAPARLSSQVNVPARVMTPVGSGIPFGRPAAQTTLHTRIPGQRTWIPGQRTWIPGQRQLVQERVWVPGNVRRVWVPPVYETRLDLWRRPVKVQLAPGRWQTVQDPGHYELRTKRVWQPGRWVAVRYGS